MPTIVLHLRNMVSSRCIRAVEVLANDNGLQVTEMVSLGRVGVQFEWPEQLVSFEDALNAEGFTVVRSAEEQLVEAIKGAAIELFYHGNNTNSLLRNSDHLSERTGQPYTVLSRVFSERTGITLERYIILLKAERVKELLSYHDLSLSEISYQMGYSSVQYLSTQFKQVTGVTVSEFKEGKGPGRVALDRLLNTDLIQR
ncbi:MAG: helix-turn-helix transcriptional regulator [Flavobacteriales bacterium]|nr:helix-turn-helix transcriptional regulator [Flavobacteriales bacterium]